MKKLIALISPEGKSKEQLADEAHEAVQKYFKVEKEVSAKKDGLNADHSKLSKYDEQK